MAELLKVYVHLARGYDAVDWERRWRDGSLVGFNEPSPYGYHHAASASCRLRFSHDAAEGRLGTLMRGGLRVLLGFDLLHAWRNRAALREADVVWTHTESQHLSVAAILKTMPRSRRPKLLAQSVWLIDGWESFGNLRRRLYRWLMAEAGVLTFHSPLNRARAQALFPTKRCEIVPFGISTDTKVAPILPVRRDRIRLLALGNDRHRDWTTLLAAFGGRPDYELRIATGRLSAKDVAGLPNVTLARPRHNDELMALYAWADVVVLPLLGNLHASGATVLQEAALAGRPTVCSRVGGIDSYFTDDEVTYVLPGDSGVLRTAVDGLAADPVEALRRARAAQARMSSEGLGSRAYARAHVVLSREMLRHRFDVAVQGADDRFAAATHPPAAQALEARR